ncbi:MAG: thiamine phosphate synthase [Pyrinomonadaceae bacterium]
MFFKKAVTYLITPGRTETFNPEDPHCARLIQQVKAAVESGISMIQLREKKLSARNLYLLSLYLSEITHGTGTQLFINDRADIAQAVSADGVHLSTHSLKPEVVKKNFADRLLIGVSTHNLAEALAARESGADFVVFGPVYETISKKVYGPPRGVESFHRTAESLKGFPLIALGGVTIDKFNELLTAGASGIAGIDLFADTARYKEIAFGTKHAQQSLQAKKK